MFIGALIGAFISLALTWFKILELVSYARESGGKITYHPIPILIELTMFTIAGAIIGYFVGG